MPNGSIKLGEFPPILGTGVLLSSCIYTAIYRPLASLQRWSLDLVHYCASEMAFWPNQIKKLLAYQVQMLSYSEFHSTGEMGWQNFETTYGFQSITIFFCGREAEGWECCFSQSPSLFLLPFVTCLTSNKLS